MSKVLLAMFAWTVIDMKGSHPMNTCKESQEDDLLLRVSAHTKCETRISNVFRMYFCSYEIHWEDPDRG